MRVTTDVIHYCRPNHILIKIYNILHFKSCFCGKACIKNIINKYSYLIFHYWHNHKSQKHQKNFDSVTFTARLWYSSKIIAPTNLNLNQVQIRVLPKSLISRFLWENKPFSVSPHQKFLAYEAPAPCKTFPRCTNPWTHKRKRVPARSMWVPLPQHLASPEESYFIIIILTFSFW